MTPSDGGVIDVDPCSDVAVMIVIEMVTVCGKRGVEDPLHPAILKQNVMQPRRMVDRVKPVVCRCVGHDWMVATTAVANRLQASGLVAMAEGVAEVASHLSHEHL